jgi:hypothetical protein
MTTKVSMENCKNTNCNNIVNNVHINVLGNRYFHPSHGTLMTSYRQVIQSQQCELPNHNYNLPKIQTQTSLQQLIFNFKSCNSGKNADNWSLNFRIALTAYQNNPNSLRGGYNDDSDDFKVSMRVANQRKGLPTMSREKKDLLRLIGV